MKIIRLIKFQISLVIISLCCNLIGCAPTSSVIQSTPITYPVIGAFDNLNEVFKGTVREEPGVGKNYVEMRGQVTGIKCSGYTYATEAPAYSVDCKGWKGEANLTCDDGRIIKCLWEAISCGKGIAKGVDQNGNTLSFVYGMSDVEASSFIKKLSIAVSTLPSVPPLYKPKEIRKEKGINTGTGFFVSQDGYIITNYHVVEGANEIIAITNDKRILKANFVKGDPFNDIALLKVITTSKPLRISTDTSLGKGEEVLTLGYPLVAIQGQEPKATFGRINALTGIQGDIRFVQIDVPIQPGNSGGPLLNKKGQVIGVVTMTLSEVYKLKEKGIIPQNVNYAVKSDYIIPLIRYSIEDTLKRVEIPKDRKEMKEIIEICEPSVVLIAAR